MFIREDDTEFEGDGSTSAWGGLCLECDTALPPLDRVAAQYFVEGHVVCRHCGNKVDPWKSVEIFSERGAQWFMGLPAIGAKLTLLSFFLRPAESKTMDFSEHGVPADAVLLSVNYTPAGDSCFPIEVHGHDARARRVGSRVVLYGRPRGKGGDAVKVMTAVSWVPRRPDAQEWELMADAFEAATDRRFARALFSAHSSFELALSRLIRLELEKYASKDAVERFITADLTAEVALNILLPYACANAVLPKLPDSIRGHLNRLRGLRNKIAHGGLSDEQVDEKEAWRCLCAAVFGFEFVLFAKGRTGESPAAA